MASSTVLSVMDTLLTCFAGRGACRTADGLLGALDVLSRRVDETPCTENAFVGLPGPILSPLPEGAGIDLENVLSDIGMDAGRKDPAKVVFANSFPPSAFAIPLLSLRGGRAGGAKEGEVSGGKSKFKAMLSSGTSSVAAVTGS